jgi:hypothetical protein
MLFNPASPGSFHRLFRLFIRQIARMKFRKEIISKLSRLASNPLACEFFLP